MTLFFACEARTAGCAAPDDSHSANTLQSTGFWLNTLMIFAAGPLVLAGLLLLKRGWLPRRAGPEPRCGACGYDLTANRSGRCPECGAALSAAGAVVAGRWPRRIGMGVVGAVLLLMGAACLTPGVRRAVLLFDWYALKPDGWVLRDLAKPSEVDKVRALAQLRWRILKGRLSPARQREFVEVLLDAQAANPGAVPDGFLAHLGARLDDDSLTNAQRDRFLRNLIRLELRVPPPVTAGAPVAYQLVHSHRAPPTATWLRRVEVLSVSLDGGEPALNGARPFTGKPGQAADEYTAPPQSLGPHALRARVRVSLARTPEALEPNAGAAALYDADLAVDAEFDVLP